MYTTMDIEYNGAQVHVPNWLMKQAVKLVPNPKFTMAPPKGNKQADLAALAQALQSGKPNPRRNGRNRNQNSGVPIRTTRVPAAMGYVVSRTPAKIKSDGRSFTISNREIFADVEGKTALDKHEYSINPGIAENFPWCEKQAANFDRYRVKRLKFTYVPSAAVTTTIGEVYLAMVYNPGDFIPETIQAISALETVKQSRAYEKMELNVPVGRLHSGVQSKMIRNGPRGGDLMLFDSGKLIIATRGFAGTLPAGQIWVDYEFELRDPSISNGVAQVTDRVIAFFLFDQGLTHGVPATMQFTSYRLNGMRLSSAAAGAYTVGSGQFMVTVTGTMTTDVTTTLDCIMQVFSTPTGGAPVGHTKTRAEHALDDSPKVFLSNTSYVDLSESPSGGTIECQVTVFGTGNLSLIAETCIIDILAL